MPPTLRNRILIASAVFFALSSAIPAVTIGCLHHATVEMGLPFPWLGVDVTYGAPVRQGEFFAPGPIERIEGFHVLSTLPFALVTALLLGLAAVYLMKAVAGAGGFFWGARSRDNPVPR